MAQRLSNSLTYICGTVKDSFVPAFIFGTALVLFYGQMPFTSELSQLLYYIFSAVSAIVLILLYLINRSKPFFSLLLGITAFLVLNHLKHTYGQECIHQTQYIWLCFLLPLNLLVFYFLPAFRLRSKKGIIITFFLLLQMILLEHANGLILNIPFVKIYWQSMPLWSVALWFSVLVLLAINISFKNTLPNTGLFYADVALFLGFIYADNASAVSVFSLTFATILLGVTLLDLYNGYKHDILQYVDSYNLYLSRAANKFPFKYTVGLFCLDNREKIMTQAGAKSLRILEQMLINKIIEEAPEDTEIYRYKNDEFLLVYKNEDAKHAFEYCDNIRRAVAAAEFVLNNKQSFKLTISVCVSEKTRKYIDADIVAERAHNGLQKGGRFNSNIVTMVEK